MTRLRAVLLEMASSEILSIVPTSEYLRIKQKDPHPLFRAYVIGHEGTSTGQISIDGENFFGVAKKWFRSAIENMHRKIKEVLGLKLFHGHDYLENNPSRQPIGEVVGNALKEIGGKLSEIIIAYIYEPFRNLPLDVASIEADVILEDNGTDFRAEVGSISGIALANSSMEQPGFPGATLLGFCQEFAESRSNLGGGKMTLEEIKSQIKADGIKPSDLFARSVLNDDPEVKSIIEGERREAAQGEYEHRKRTDTKFDEEREKWNKEKADLEKTNKELRSKLAKTDIGTKVDELLKKRRIEDEKEVEYIKSELGKFEPQDPDKIDEELDKALDTTVEDFARVSKLFGHEKSGDGGGNGDDKDKPDEGVPGPKPEQKAEGDEADQFIP